MDQGQIVCSFCSAEFTVPSGLNEAICPKCGKAMPLFSSKIGASLEDGFPPEAEEEEFWDTVEDFQDEASIEEPDAIGRIALKQMPADQLRQPKRTMMGQGVSSNPGLSSLATTDQDGRLIPDVIHGEDGASADAGGNGCPPPIKRPLESGFNLGLETALSVEDNESGIRPLAGLTPPQPPAPPAGGMPNLLDELDAELDGGTQGPEEDIPEAEPLMEVADEVSDFFESEQTPGLVLPDNGAISVSIPEEPIQERMRHEAVSMSSSNSTIRSDLDGSKGSAEGKGSRQTSVTSELTPVLRSAIFVGLGVGVMLLVGLLYWLLQ